MHSVLGGSDVRGTDRTVAKTTQRDKETTSCGRRAIGHDLLRRWRTKIQLQCSSIYRPITDGLCEDMPLRTPPKTGQLGTNSAGSSEQNYVRYLTVSADTAYLIWRIISMDYSVSVVLLTVDWAVSHSSSILVPGQVTTYHCMFAAGFYMSTPTVYCDVHICQQDVIFLWFE